MLTVSSCDTQFLSHSIASWSDSWKQEGAGFGSSYHWPASSFLVPVEILRLFVDAALYGKSKL